MNTLYTCKGENFSKWHAFWRYLIIYFTFNSINNLIRALKSSAAVNQNFFKYKTAEVGQFVERSPCIKEIGVRSLVETDLSP